MNSVKHNGKGSGGKAVAHDMKKYETEISKGKGMEGGASSTGL